MVSLASFNDAIPLAEAVVDSGACTIPAGDPPGPPGSGPSNETLQNPTFTPWSRTLATPFDKFAPVNADGLSWTDLDRTMQRLADELAHAPGEEEGELAPALRPRWISAAELIRRVAPFTGRN